MWQHLNTFSVGGVQNVGFADNSDILLVLSSQGTGIFDCLLGQKVFRNLDEWWGDFDQTDNTIAGVGQLKGTRIKTCGMYGDDSLSKKTHDGWSLVLLEKQPGNPPFEKYFVDRLFLINPDKQQTIQIANSGACETRAWGFSNTGKSLILALSCDLVIWRRDI